MDLDASKEFGSGAYVYHSSEDGKAAFEAQFEAQSEDGKAVSAPKQKTQQPIFFLSRLLTDAETRYWLTELEIAGLVWVVKKIRHIIEAAIHTTIIYTDHSAAVSIVRQTSFNTTSTEKLKSSTHSSVGVPPTILPGRPLQTGEVEHCTQRALSRLASQEYRAEKEEVSTVKRFPATLVTMSPAF